MKKASANPRLARVTLTVEHVASLLTGETIKVRLRTVHGEEQIVEFACPAKKGAQHAAGNSKRKR